MRRSKTMSGELIKVTKGGRGDVLEKQKRWQEERKQEKKENGNKQEN